MNKCPHCGQMHANTNHFCPVTGNAIDLGSRLVSVRLLEQFRVVTILGEGPIGAVAEVEEISSGRHFAAKLIHPQYTRDAESAQKLLEDVERANNLECSHIAKVVKTGRDAGAAITVVRELMTGHCLATRIEQVGQLGLRAALPIAREILVALNALHKGNLLHLDLSPSDIFLAQTTTAIHTKILDIGDYHIKGKLPSDLREKIASSKYYAPEQRDKSRQPSLQSDIYAVGAILYEMLTGAPPAVDPKPIESTRKDIPASLSLAVKRALDPIPEKRFASAQEFIAALDQVTAELDATSRGASISATPAPVIQIPSQETPVVSQQPAVTPILQVSHQTNAAQMAAAQMAAAQMAAAQQAAAQQAAAQQAAAQQAAAQQAAAQQAAAQQAAAQQAAAQQATVQQAEAQQAEAQQAEAQQAEAQQAAAQQAAAQQAAAQQAAAQQAAARQAAAQQAAAARQAAAQQAAAARQAAAQQAAAARQAAAQQGVDGEFTEGVDKQASVIVEMPEIRRGGLKPLPVIAIVLLSIAVGAIGVNYLQGEESVEEPLVNTPRKVQLTIEVIPKNAVIMVDGKEVVGNPAKIEVDQNFAIHTVLAKADGYETRERDIKFDESKAILFDLKANQPDEGQQPSGEAADKEIEEIPTPGGGMGAAKASEVGESMPKTALDSQGAMDTKKTTIPIKKKIHQEKKEPTVKYPTAGTSVGTTPATTTTTNGKKSKKTKKSGKSKDEGPGGFKTSNPFG